MCEEDSLTPLREHPAFALADQVAEFIGVERDLVQFVEFLSMFAQVCANLRRLPSRPVPE